MKKILITIGIIVAVLLIAVGIGAYYFYPNEHKVLDFIKSNPDKSAIYLIRNDSVLANQNADKEMPLASTVKIIIAIEYAEQCANGTLNPDEMVALSELNNYYVPNTDGDAHPDWLAHINAAGTDSVPIRAIAKGMIVYSSNANTDWLLQRLHVAKVNERLQLLNMNSHTPIYPLVGSLFIGKLRFPNIKGKALADSVSNIKPAVYWETAQAADKLLQQDPNYRNTLEDVDLDYQKVWSDRLPSSTPFEYALLMDKINKRSYFSAQVHSYLDEVMQVLMENPNNASWLKHAGMKGGSTAYVLTKALYATDTTGSTTALAYFFNDLSVIQGLRLQMSMNDFELKILNSNAFRNEVAEALATR